MGLLLSLQTVADERNGKLIVAGPVHFFAETVSVRLNTCMNAESPIWQHGGPKQTSLHPNANGSD